MTPQERLDRLVKGNDPCLIGEMKSGFAVMSETQYLEGYCLLLANPRVDQLNALEGSARRDFLEDMGAIGDAIQAITGCKRINYGIYGNLDPFLHAHIWPRYEGEDSALATLPPLSFPAEVRLNSEYQFNPAKHGVLQAKIRQALFAR